MSDATGRRYFSALQDMRAKLRRAFRQTMELEREMHEFCEAQGKLILPEFNPNNREYPYGWVYRGDPSQAFSDWQIRIGEIIHNARSALDNLVHAAVLANRQEPSRGNAFPVLGSKEWKKWDDEKLKGVPEFVIERIKQVQSPLTLPFAPADFEMLEVLHELWNTDKHRHPNYLIAKVVKMWSFPDGADGPDKMQNYRYLEPGKAVVAFNKKSTRPPLHIDVYFDARATTRQHATHKAALHTDEHFDDRATSIDNKSVLQKLRIAPATRIIGECLKAVDCAIASTIRQPMLSVRKH